MNEALAFFLTVFGVGGIPIALGFLLATRGAVPQPWLAPWRASYGCFALGFLVALAAAHMSTQPLFLALGQALFMAGIGLQTLGWLRLWRGPLPSPFAALPLGLYGVLYLAWGRFWAQPKLAALFSLLFALTSAVGVVGAYRGLPARRPHRRVAITLFLALNALFWAVRGVHILAVNSRTEHLYAFAAAGLECTLYLGILAGLQWSVVMD